MKAIILCAALLAATPSLADGFGYQGDDGSTGGYGYQSAPDWSFPSGNDYVQPCCVYPESPGTYSDE